MSQAEIPLASHDEALAVCGPRDANLKALTDRYGVDLVARRGTLRIIGEEDAVRRASAAVGEMLEVVRSGGSIAPGEPPDPEAAPAASAAPGGRTPAADLHGGDPAAPAPAGEGGATASATPAAAPAGDDPEPPAHVLRLPQGAIRPPTGVTARTAGQAAYLEAIASNPVVFGTGPAGTGKTFLATAMAVSALRMGRVKKLILTRPAVEAGEHLGFLPGDYHAKINPYLRPLYDALGLLLDPGQLRRFTENDVIEVAPLAYMRGRTLDAAFIILDEAQNSTVEQMKMFLTRMGGASRTVVTGDTTQTDLPSGKTSGLVDAVARLEGIRGIGICRLGPRDIVRHPLVQRIVDAYDEESEA